MFKTFLVVYACLQTRSFSSGKQCPEDSIFNSTTQNCTDCGSGYYGVNCFQACRYPNYGSGCQRSCHCKERNCNHIKGCLINESEDDINSHTETIGISITCGFLFVIAVFIFTMKAKRRFSACLIRHNTHDVGSMVAEHSASTLNYPHTTLNYPEIPENNIYMLASSIKYENVNQEN